MTKETYKRNSLLGACSFRGLVYDHQGGEHGSKQAGRHGFGVVSDSLHLLHKQETKRKLTRNGKGF